MTFFYIPHNKYNHNNIILNIYIISSFLMKTQREKDTSFMWLRESQVVILSLVVTAMINIKWKLNWPTKSKAEWNS